MNSGKFPVSREKDKREYRLNVRYVDGEEERFCIFHNCFEPTNGGQWDYIAVSEAIQGYVCANRQVKSFTGVRS